MSKKTITVDWSEVEANLNEKTTAGYKVAIIEANKALDGVLQALKIPGKTMRDRLGVARSSFQDFDTVMMTQEVFNRIVHEREEVDLSREAAENILASYYQAITDLTQRANGKLSTLTRVRAALRGQFAKPVKIARWTVGLLIAFCLAVVFIADTGVGQLVSGDVLTFARFVVYKFLLVVAILIGGAIIIIGTLFYFETRRQQNKFDVEE